MARFERPQSAIADFRDLRVGDVVYEVYGIWPPCRGKQKTVTRAPIKFSEHPEYSDIHKSSADKMVFDLAYPDGLTVMSFASDRNLMPGHSHNDNYLFRSEEDAESAVIWLRDRWSSSPGSIAEEVERMFTWDSFDDRWEDHDYFTEVDELCD